MLFILHLEGKFLVGCGRKRFSGDRNAGAAESQDTGHGRGGCKAKPRLGAAVADM
jgi:hypothetical protein